jgi:hypothetical protein
LFVGWVCFAGREEYLRHAVWSIDGIAYPRRGLHVGYESQRRRPFCDVSEFECHIACVRYVPYGFLNDSGLVPSKLATALLHPAPKK